MKSVVAYPSGFVGYDVGWPIRSYSADLEEKLSAIRLSKVAAPKEKTVISNPVVETLFQQWRDGVRKASDIDFIEEVLGAAIYAFGTPNLYEWAHLQTKNPYFTADHRHFLNETFTFIEEGKRHYSYVTWIKTLQMRLAGPQDSKVFYTYQDFFRLRDPALLRVSTDVISVLQRWMERPGGLIDILQTLHVIFGESAA